MSKIIAICGLKGAGKDTVTDMLLYLFNVPKVFHSYFWFRKRKFLPYKHKYSKVAFADPIKEMLSHLLNMPRKNFESRTIKENCLVCFGGLDIVKNKTKDIIQYNTLSDSKFSKLAEKWDSELSARYYLTIRQVMQLFGTDIMRKLLDDKIWINCILNRGTNKNIIISDLRFIAEFEEVKRRNGTIVYVDRGLPYGNHRSESEIETMVNQNKFDFTIHNKNISLEQLFYLVKRYKELYL